MSYFDYEMSKQISIERPPFYALIMAAMRQADSTNLSRLRAAFPEVWDELYERYNAPGGLLPGEVDPSTQALSATITMTGREE